jgi:ERO1-like protein alpha
LKDCPFWVENFLCSADGGGDCQICECDENEIPEPWRQGKVEPTHKEAIHNWHEEDEDVWIIQDDTEDTSYVNLQLNPERFTGYGGGNSTRIWMAIYQENCFPDPHECFEQRVFHRLISGLHASTTAHICEQYHMPDGTWAPNYEMFAYRLGMFPERLKNIYFSFVYVLRAAIKASPFMTQYNYYTANPEDDTKVSALIHQLFTHQLLCSSATFDESTMFKGERASLKREFMQKFRNISEIMDCVSCQTCKVHAKLQILGIATATKILMAEDNNIIAGLQRNEIIALVNTLQKFSDAIQIIHHMREIEKNAEQQKPTESLKSTTTTTNISDTNYYTIFVAVIILTITSLKLFYTNIFASFFIIKNKNTNTNNDNKNKNNNKNNNGDNKKATKKGT